MKVEAVIGHDCVAGLVGEDHIVAGRVRPIGIRSGRLERLDAGLHGLAGLVDQLAV
jgi:hypothetical protein